MDDLLRFCRTEAARCRKAVAKGSPRAFWVPRLRAAIQRLDEAQAILLVCLDELLAPPKPTEGGDGGA